MSSFDRGTNMGLVIMLVIMSLVHDVRGLERSIEVMRFNWIDTWSIWNILLYFVAVAYVVMLLRAEVKAKLDEK